MWIEGNTVEIPLTSSSTSELHHPLRMADASDHFGRSIQDLINAS